MPNVRDQNHHKSANVPKKTLVVPVETAVSLTNAVIFSHVIGHKFEITRVRSFCRTKAGAVSFKVKAGTREAVPAGTTTAATEVAQTLSTTKANVRGSATEAVTVELTTDGTGALTNGRVVIEYRPFPLAGDLGPI